MKNNADPIKLSDGAVPQSSAPIKEPQLPDMLSPSRMSDFNQCQRLFYYKSVLRMPTTSGEAAVKGSLVHLVLEYLFQRPAPERTEELAQSLVRPSWEEMRVERNGVNLEPFGTAIDDASDGVFPKSEEEMLKSASDLVTSYFGMETPSGFEPLQLEMKVEAKVGKYGYRGIVDRLDDIEFRGERAVFVSDYKTGKIPNPRWMDDKWFPMWVYAVLLTEIGIPGREKGEAPDWLRLVYVAAGSKKAGIFTVPVTEHKLELTRKKMNNISATAEKNFKTGNWPTKTSPLCNWCDFKPICPAHNPQLEGMIYEERAVELDHVH